MNLLEVLLAAVVFLSASGASLQLWSRSGAAAVGQERWQLGVDRLDAALQTADARWRSLASGGPAAGPCGPLAAELAVRLAAAAPPAGVTRSVSVAADGEAVLVEVRDGELDLERRRLFSPAAAGVCGGVP